MYTYTMNGRCTIPLAISDTHSDESYWLSQVPVAGGGTDQLVNLFGFDSSSRRQKSVSSGALALLADGLGSVRLEMVGGAVKATTTYSPYGKALAQEGDSSTDYGFTGEHEDDSTGLLYLRARYYSSGLMAFLSRDPWQEREYRPKTFNGFNYGNNDPTNYIDPAGLQPELPDPYDPEHCDDWSFPRRISCAIITGSGTPEWLRYTEMVGIYMEILIGMNVSGRFEHAPDFWHHYFFGRSALGNGDVSLQGSDWGNWIRTHRQDREMHEQQLNDFFYYHVLPAAQDCQTEVGPIEVRRDYPFVEAGSATHDVTVALGRHYLEGDFYARNIQLIGSSLVLADVEINRFINDRFDFKNDGGGIPINEVLKSVGIPNVLGIGYVPNVWAAKLDEVGLAQAYDIHFEWTESFNLRWNLWGR